MMTDHRKRAWKPWYLMPVDQQPICPTCKVACTVTSTQKTNGGESTVQYRKCPQCGKTSKTVY